MRRLHEFRFVSDGRMFEIGASIGLVAVTPQSGRVETVLSCADLAQRYGHKQIAAKLTEKGAPVAEALSDHLLWVSGVEKPSIPLSTIRPWMRPSSFLAQTTAMSAKGEFDIQSLAPFSRKWSPSSIT